MIATMPSLRELSYGLYGTWRLARLDFGALKWFDRSAEGVKRSFWVAVIAYPGFVLLLALHAQHRIWATIGFSHVLLIESIGYVIGWTAFPLAVLLLCRWLGREEQGFGFIAVYNWSQLLQTGLLFLVALLRATHILRSGPIDILATLTVIAILGYEWYVARIAIGAGAAVATTIVLLDLVLTEIVNRATLALY